MNLDKVKALIKEYHDFPKPGILFRDIHPIVADDAARAFVTEHLRQRYQDKKIDIVVGLESRGYYFGVLLATALKVPFVPFRKPGKLPGEIIIHEYKLEYGTDKLCVQRSAVPKGARIVIVDDLMATGGTASAAVKLAREAGGEVVEVHCIIELADLAGHKKLDAPFYPLFPF